jgi:signal transduction histidine kinase
VSGPPATLPDFLLRYPGMVLLFSAEGVVRASNGRLEERGGSDAVGRRFSDLLDAGSVSKWSALLEGADPPPLVELVLKDPGAYAVYAFAVVRDGRGDEPRLWLFEQPAELRGTTVFDEMSALNAELSQAHRQLARERERLSRALTAEAEARAAAQSALSQRDEVLGVVAHDLRNPLNVISMAAKQLRMSLPAPPDERLLDILDRVVRSMDRLIGDLLEVRRLDAGALRLDFSAFEVPELVQQAWEEMAPVAERRNVRLERDGPPAPPLKADRGRLMQVLFNLLENAIRVTRAGSTVHLSARPVDGGVEFAVVDGGPGIAPEDLPHIFDRFWQGRRAGGSAGLGLTIVKGIVEAHGGRVEVESTAGQGSTFRFTIPSGGS